MKYISAIEDKIKFHWQSQVQHYNLIVELGVNPKDIILLIGYSDKINLEFNQYCNNIGINCYYYDSSKLDKTYKAITRPFLYREFYKNNPKFVDEYVFILDSDVILTNHIDFSKYKSNDTWYLSDCSNYIGYQYLKKYGETLLEDCLEVVGLDEDLYFEKDIYAGGAQFFGKGLDWKFWDKVLKDTDEIYKILKIQTEINKQEYKAQTGKDLTKDNAIQKWTAGMWAELWNLYLVTNVITPKEFDFSWGTSDRKKYFKRKIHHNAGVTLKKKDLYFRKNEYTKRTPFNDTFNYSNLLACHYYCDKIEKTKKWLENGNLL